MKNVMTYKGFQQNKYYYVTEPLNEEIDLSKIFKGKTPEEKKKGKKRKIR